MIVIELTGEDYMVASTKATVRVLKAMQKDRIGNDHGGSSSRRISTRIADGVTGELAEIAFSRYSGLASTSRFEEMHRSDFPGGLEVRGSDWNNANLLIHDTSPDDSFYVLVQIVWFQAVIRGGIYAREAKKPSWKRQGDPAYYSVPSSSLVKVPGL